MIQQSGGRIDASGLKYLSTDLWTAEA